MFFCSRQKAGNQQFFCSRQKAGNQHLNNFSARDKRPATSKQLQSGVRSRRTSCPRSSSSKVKGTRRGRLSHLQQVADQRRAELQQRFADRAVHLTQRQLKNLR